MYFRKLLWLIFFFIGVCINSLSAESVDRRLFNQIHGRWNREWLNNPMQFCTDVGEAKVGIAICAGVGLYGGEKARQSAKLSMTSDIASAAITYGLKNIINRGRPLGPTERSNSSFPSGHATGAFAIGTVFAHRYPKIAIPCYLGATGVCVSRIYIGRHYPSDVLAGAAIGFVTAKIVIHFQKKIINFKLPLIGD
jgi:membrane-associated phospholipid phosphatase